MIVQNIGDARVLQVVRYEPVSRARKATRWLAQARLPPSCWCREGNFRTWLPRVEAGRMRWRI
jgi:hypothetical protein